MCVIKAALRNPDTKTEERRRFAQEFMSLVLQKKHIWLIDESSVRQDITSPVVISLFLNQGFDHLKKFLITFPVATWIPHITLPFCLGQPLGTKRCAEDLVERQRAHLSYQKHPSPLIHHHLRSCFELHRRNHHNFWRFHEPRWIQGISLTNPGAHWGQAHHMSNLPRFGQPFGAPQQEGERCLRWLQAAVFASLFLTLIRSGKTLVSGQERTGHPPRQDPIRDEPTPVQSRSWLVVHEDQPETRRKDLLHGSKRRLIKGVGSMKN